MMIHHLCTFAPAGKVHGGTLRTQQVAELAGHLGMSRTATVRDTLTTARPGRVLHGGISSAVGLLIDPRAAVRWRTSFFSTELAMKMAARDASAILWEPRAGVQPRGLAIAGIPKPVIAFPQNIEALVAPFIRTRSRRSWSRFRGELEALAACAGVFVISREEQWLLGSIGIASEHYPYQPSTSRQHWLDEVRSLRKRSEQDSILILGTQANGPTRSGMYEIVQALGARRGGSRVVVVGAGSEQLNIPAPINSKVEIAGYLSDRELMVEMSRATHALVWQPPTSGWPTRLVELPYCGVPVIANTGALRAQEFVPGVTLASTTDDAISMLDSTQPGIDYPLTWDSGRTLAKLKGMIHAAPATALAHFND